MRITTGQAISIRRDTRTGWREFQANPKRHEYYFNNLKPFLHAEHDGLCVAAELARLFDLWDANQVGMLGSAFF